MKKYLIKYKFIIVVNITKDINYMLQFDLKNSI